MTISRRESGKSPIGRTKVDRFRGPKIDSHCDTVATPFDTSVRQLERPGRYTATDEAERFWSQVKRPPWWRPWGCARWAGTLNTEGYPVMGVWRDGAWVKVRAHRYALELALGADLPFPSVGGALLRSWEVAGHDCHDRARRCHRGRDCRHRACVKAWEGPWWLPWAWRRPHVLPMTQAENRRRVDARRRAR